MASGHTTYDTHRNSDEPATVSAPVEWVQSVGDLGFPPQTQRRLDDLMDRHNDGLLDQPEQAELASLVEVSESISLVRAEALHLLGQRPE